MTSADRIQAIIRVRFHGATSPLPRRSCCTPACVWAVSTWRIGASCAAGSSTTLFRATGYPTAHRRTHPHHVHGRRLYRAIGEPVSRHRKPTTPGRAVERLMVLDAVLVSPEMRWLGTASEKVAYFTAATSLQIDRW